MWSAEPVKALTKLEFHHLVEHINECLINQTNEAVFSTLDWLREFSECERLVFCQLDRSEPDCFKELINHSYGDEWIDTYRANNFNRIDPVIQLAVSKPGTIRWTDAYRLAENAQARKFIRISNEHGLIGGVAHSYIDDHHISLCSMTHSPRKNRGLDYVLESLTPAMHLTFKRERTTCKNLLSTREMEVLRWAGQGKTVWEMSVILSVSQSTVKFHLANIYAKLNVSNRAQAMSAAVRLGFL